jgi:AcrR family transcriptional regulator
MPRVVKKAEERKKEIINAARELFREKGRQKVTMQELMNKLNIAKGTIYHHFTSKDELLEAIVEDLIDEELARKKKLMNSRRFKILNALEKLQLFITQDTMAQDNEAILENLHHSQNADMHAKQLGRYLIKLAPLLASIFEEGGEEGIFKTDHPLECAEFLLAGFQFLTDTGFYPWTQPQLIRRVKAFSSLAEDLLGTPKGTLAFLNERLSGA